jgi:hypothetical protein
VRAKNVNEIPKRWLDFGLEERRKSGEGKSGEGKSGEGKSGESWQTFQDKKTGNPYYYNIETGESTWEKPRINKSGGGGKSWAEPSLMLKRLGSRQVSVCHCCL